MLQMGFKCETGLVRKNNEDACFVLPNKDTYIVADGVGGNSHGELASRTTVSEIARYINEEDIDKLDVPDKIFELLLKAIKIANDEIHEIIIKDIKKSGMATTLVLAYIRDNQAYIANIGDSRAYLYRAGNLQQITKDHTYVNELLERGTITKEEADNHEHKNVITRAIGADKNVIPDFYQVKLNKNDIIILCSDGLYGEVSDAKIVEILNDDINMKDAANALTDAALASGGKDNITVVCLRV